jgi:hypothetical protein
MVYMSQTSIDRVREYLRQFDRLRDTGGVVHNVHTDPEMEQVSLTSADLHELLDQVAPREDPKADLARASNHELTAELGRRLGSNETVTITRDVEVEDELRRQHGLPPRVGAGVTTDVLTATKRRSAEDIADAWEAESFRPAIVTEGGSIEEIDPSNELAQAPTEDLHVRHVPRRTEELGPTNEAVFERRLLTPKTDPYDIAQWCGGTMEIPKGMDFTGGPYVIDFTNSEGKISRAWRGDTIVRDIDGTFTLEPGASDEQVNKWRARYVELNPDAKL